MISVALQKVFFPKLKVPPKPKWVRSLAHMGNVKPLEVKRNGRTISTLLVTPKHQTQRGCVIMAHPVHPKGKYYFTEGKRIRLYLEKGLAVFLFDFNGFGESDRIDLYFSRDAAAVIDKAKRLFPMSPQILHGVSFGSFHIVPALDHLPPNSSIILENTSRSLYDYWKKWLHTRAIVWIALRLPAPPIQNMNILRFLSKLNRLDLKFTLIACDDDWFTPAGEMKDLYRAIKVDEKRFEIVTGAKHLKAPNANSDRYNQIIYSVINDGVNNERNRAQNDIPLQPGC